MSFLPDFPIPIQSLGQNKEDKVKAQYTEETIASRPFIVKGINAVTYESDYYRRRAKNAGQRAWYMRSIVLYANGAWVTVNGRATGAKFRVYSYWIIYNKKTKKWRWKWAGHYYVTLAPGAQHTVKTRWKNKHHRRYTYVYRYEPTTYQKIAAPAVPNKAAEVFSMLNPATLLNTADQLNILESVGIHSTLSEVSSGIFSMFDTAFGTSEGFDIQLAIAESDVKGSLETDAIDVGAASVQSEEIEIF